MAGFIIGTIVILILAIRLIQVLRSCDEKDSTCIQVKLCADGKMICSRKPSCNAFKKVTRASSLRKG